MMQPSFETVDGGLAVRDPIERHRYALSTPGSVEPVPADTAQFRFPVDAAVSVRTAGISMPSVISVHIRDAAGTPLCTAEHFAAEKLPKGRYTIELSAPMKLYLRVKSAVKVSADAEGMDIDFGAPTEVVVGARSHHDRPATTVTTTAAPEDMMRAVSTFGSALKTTSPERSYPTLRGHPPTVELGADLDLAGLEPPETGVTIEVPPEYRAIFVVSSLAYYLGARVVPGDDPVIRTDEGFVYPLDGPEGFERTVERTLKQVFFLDCLTRTEGLYPVDLHERDALESGLGLDFGGLYDSSLADQLEAYLAVPFAAVESQIPDWKLTTHVEPTATSVETLPFVVDDLAVVQCASTATAARSDVLMYNGGVEAATARHKEGFTRSTGTDTATEIDAEFVNPAATDSLEQAWVGEGTPLGASKTVPEAYRNRLDRAPADGDITITVVCNDDEMAAERDLIDEIYGDRDELPFDVSLHRDLTATELEDILSTRTDFLHYIGHVDSEGFECTNGTLDASTLDTVGVDAFLLNACQSYRQGMALIEAGAIGGIATLTDVLNCEAVGMGRTLAGLLNCGFPLRAALDVARDERIMGEEYIVVGDGGLAVAQSASGNPNLLHIEKTDVGFCLNVECYPTSQWGMGTLIMPRLDDSIYHLSTGDVESTHLSTKELEEFLMLENAPVKIDGKLHWSYQINPSDL